MTNHSDELPLEDNNDNTDMIEALSTREAAFDALDKVLIQKQPLDSVLDKLQSFLSLPARDKAFSRMIMGTTLRRLGQIDDIIAKSEERPGAISHNPSLQNILRIGIAQILFMNVPDHAAVDTAVRLAERKNMSRQKGFVNGILRNVTRKGAEYLSRQDPARLNTPEWLLKLWIEDFGLKTAAEISTANMVEAPLDITVKDQSTLNYWASTLQASSFPTGSLRKPAGGNVSTLSGFDDGMWWVQDASAAIPATLFGDIAGKTVIDLCAAPGGKTAQLAARGANAIAIDRSAQRMKRLQSNLERLRLSDQVEAFAADAAQWIPKTAPEFILLDAPCSATGTIRRHPDVMHLKTPRDIQSLIEVQKRILHHAFDILAPGGILIYCTCSLQKAEGEHQINRFIEQNPQAIRLAIAPKEIGDLNEPITEHGDIRILPFMQAASGGMDGFYIARIKKAAG
ncbi:MAG: RsmB/NOP family class I SAM-dependent RNA methyltransferase [Alphaproteobacteria bacterium]